MPPGILCAAASDGSSITWKAPGDDWYTGAADHYEIATSKGPICPPNFDSALPLPDAPDPSASGALETYTVPTGALDHVAVRALDDAGNLGPVHDFDLAGSGAPARAAGAAGAGAAPEPPPTTQAAGPVA